jgi:hypothetical protein
MIERERNSRGDYNGARPWRVSRSNLVAIWNNRLLPEPVGMLTIRPDPAGWVRSALTAAFCATHR